MSTRDLSIPRGPIELAGRLHLPEGLDPAVERLAGFYHRHLGTAS
jgi:hypothetical protein